MNKQDYIEQGRQAYKDGLDDITEAKSWQEKAFNQGWNDAHEEWRTRNPAPATPTGAMPDPQYTTFPECSASGRGCEYRPLGPNGESQCQYCGESPPLTQDEFRRETRLNVVTGALESVQDVNTPTRHALRSHAWALVSRAQTLIAQNRPERADAVIDKARRTVSHLLGREL
ncbi:hypothetical protein FBF48_10350 [Streptococcus salivarius]|uniref:Zinc ribbon domain-containing protein n=1 Tax=Streptococcus salivarius TaxID=1304 RepID=A0AAX2V0C3_STRSL|nr:hypothetical protein [Streptococcus salivarius]TNF65663.1 hypothetical protein FBF48_10350 [Streptococcus salivarius]